MTFHIYKPFFFLLLLLPFSPPIFAQDYSEDITDASTGIIEAISEHAGPVPNLAAYAFDEDVINLGWANSEASDFPAWISYEFPDTSGAKNVVAYSLICSNDQSNTWPSDYMPVRWTLEGENSDGVVLLDSVEAASLKVNEWQLFEFENDEFFEKYIFTFYETKGGFPFTFVTEMELYEPKTAVSVRELNPENLIAIYPNPVSQFLTISVKNSEVFNISVFNELGQQVDFLKDISISDNLELDCSSYGKGVYSLLFQSEDGFSTKRIVVLE